MKQAFLSAAALFLLLQAPALAQKQVSMTQGSMAWTTKSQQAKKMALIGMFHMMNVEREQAYQYFKSAVEADPEFTVPLAVLAILTTGETKKEFIRRAQLTAQNKTESEKLFASLVNEGTTLEMRQQTWAKLRAMHLNDRMIGHFYAATRPTPEEKFAALTEYVQKFPEEPAVYNMLGYYYLNDKKDFAKAKENFEKYIQLYPEGENPYDSMGEFYLTTGDLANAEKYYNLALEKYPFSRGALQALEKIKEEKKKAEQK